MQDWHGETGQRLITAIWPLIEENNKGYGHCEIRIFVSDGIQWKNNFSRDEALVDVKCPGELYIHQISFSNNIFSSLPLISPEKDPILEVYPVFSFTRFFGFIREKKVYPIKLL